MSTSTTVAAVVDRKHEDGETVIVTGFADQAEHKVTKQKNPWATFLLVEETAIRVHLRPLHYQTFGHLLPEPGSQRVLTVSGRVDAGDRVPELIATDIKAVA